MQNAAKQKVPLFSCLLRTTLAEFEVSSLACPNDKVTKGSDKLPVSPVQDFQLTPHRNSDTLSLKVT